MISVRKRSIRQLQILRAQNHRQLLRVEPLDQQRQSGRPLRLPLLQNQYKIGELCDLCFWIRASCPQFGMGSMLNKACRQEETSGGCIPNMRREGGIRNANTSILWIVGVFQDVVKVFENDTPISRSSTSGTFRETEHVANCPVHCLRFRRNKALGRKGEDGVMKCY